MAKDEPQVQDDTLPILQEQLVGTVFADRYEIDSMIGEGGMGNVYKAMHKLMKRTVAIKLVHPNLVASADTLARFQLEAEAASSLNHPNIVTVHDFGLLPRAYMVMDYLDGISLANLLGNDACLTPDRSLNIFVQVCAGLAHAHQYGVVHRDLKPSNIMLVTVNGQNDFVKIVDFGIAKLMLGKRGQSKELTTTGTILGSPLYMSPEQCQAKAMDARSDIYSLGCIMYRTLSGHQPVLGQELMECLYNHVNTLPKSFQEICPELHLSLALETVVMKCLEKKQENRFQSMLDLKEALEALDQCGKEILPQSAKELSTGTRKRKPARNSRAIDQTLVDVEVNRAASAAEANRAASVVEAGFAATALEDSLAASAKEAGRAASAAESARATSAAETARAISAAEAGRAATAAEAGRAASVAEAGRAASVHEAGLAASAVEAERAASNLESERAASATVPGAKVSAAELGRSASALESSRAAAAAESARSASATEAALVASAHEAGLAEAAAESGRVASAAEAVLAASAHEAGLAEAAAESGRAASAAESSRAASAAEAGRAASAAEAGRVATAAEAGRIASAAEK